MTVKVQGKTFFWFIREIVKRWVGCEADAVIHGLCHSFVCARYLAFITFLLLFTAGYVSKGCFERLGSPMDCSAKLYCGHVRFYVLVHM